MTERTYTSCGAIPPERGCGTCDVCIESANAERAGWDGVLTAEETAQFLAYLRDAPLPPT